MRQTKKKSDAGESSVTLKTQREILRDVLLSAAESNSWLTLNELTEMTCYAQASISAQLRHLRKRQYGGYKIEKRRRQEEETHLVSTHERVYEYQLNRSERAIMGRQESAIPTAENAQQNLQILVA